MTASVRLAVTLGDPRGIGPEIVAAVRADPACARQAQLTIVGPSGTVVPADVAIGEWTPGDSAAQAGQLAGRAIERAVALAQ